MRKRDTSVALESCARKPTRMENKRSYPHENDLNPSLVLKKTNIAFIKTLLESRPLVFHWLSWACFDKSVLPGPHAVQRQKVRFFFFCFFSGAAWFATPSSLSSTCRRSGGETWRRCETSSCFVHHGFTQLKASASENLLANLGKKIWLKND